MSTPRMHRQPKTFDNVGNGKPATAKMYFDRKGRLHRRFGPAIVTATGSRIWMRHGVMHRRFGPAHERYDGRRFWFINGRARPGKERGR